MRINENAINFDITDDSGEIPLRCSFDPETNGFVSPGESIQLEFHYYKRIPDKIPPFNDVAALKLYSRSGGFIVWYTPQKFIYEYIMGSLKATIDGKITSFIDYKVHYIGQAFSRRVWERLTGHEKMQSVLTKEDPVNSKASKNSFEISLVMLDIDGFDEANMLPFYEGVLDPKVIPIKYNLETEDDFEKFLTPILEARSPQLTNEVEAMLIHNFKPAYNNILFENYPNISNGTRSVGYSGADLLIERLPAILSSDSYGMPAMIPAGIG